MKTGGKILIASGALLAAGGIAFAISPRFRSLVTGAGSAVLTPHQKLQRAINAIIANKSFVSTDFVDTVFNYDLEQSNARAQMWVFDMANATEKVSGEAWNNFNYEGLAIISDFFPVHHDMQKQISRILQSADFAGYREQLREHYRQSGHGYIPQDIAIGIFNNASDDTQVPSRFSGTVNDYNYYPFYDVDPSSNASFWAGGKRDELQWYKEYFNGGRGSIGFHGGGTGDIGHTSGGSTGTGNGGATGSIPIDPKELWGEAKKLFCELFPSSPYCVTPDPTSCGWCSVYDEPTNSCIPDPTCNPNDPTYNPCGEGSHLNADGQCVPDEMISESCPEGFHEENGTCYPDEPVIAEDCEPGYFDFGDGNGCVPW